MFCSSCGAKSLVENAKYCSKCGLCLSNPTSESSNKTIGFEATVALTFPGPLSQVEDSNGTEGLPFSALGVCQ